MKKTLSEVILVEIGIILKDAENPEAMRMKTY